MKTSNGIRAAGISSDVPKAAPQNDPLVNVPKATSFEYGKEYQLRQAEKFRNRKQNHQRLRIQLAFDLIEKYSIPRLAGKSRQDIVIVDVGCSIGTFATEFAIAGYRSYGIDFDKAGLEIAKELAREENVSPQFVCGDVATWCDSFPPIDIAVCFDIFEHLHDDELGAMLTGIRRQMSKNGTIVFHTYPTQYDYMFYGNKRRYFQLLPFAWLPTSMFETMVKMQAAFEDILLLMTRGVTYREMIKRAAHCNPLSESRLRDIFNRAGFDVLCLEVTELYEYRASRKWRKIFARHPISRLNLHGVAAIKPTV